jgi:predicted ATPase
LRELIPSVPAAASAVEPPRPAEQSFATHADTARFLLRAQQLRHGVALDAAVVERLVDRLGGSSLALELVASRAATVALDEVVKALPGEVTLSEVLQWTCGLLAPWERAALAQVAAARDGLGIEEAEAVIDLSAFPAAPWALDVLQTLTELALLHGDSGGGGELRFTMHEAVRAWALEQPERAERAAI